MKRRVARMPVARLYVPQGIWPQLGERHNMIPANWPVVTTADVATLRK